MCILDTFQSVNHIFRVDIREQLMVVLWVILSISINIKRIVWFPSRIFPFLIMHIWETPTDCTDAAKSIQERTHSSAVLCLVAQLCPTLGDPMNLACEAPLSMGFSRQE